ncbi:hypothetical protein ACIRPH_31355 [Nocardiopsis sp. NPDC101807]|uniref:hypothetical protein n=1 Tax=Nocardiopsis sp. NPDC101807 TaxID=3364339 RepID=UPI00380F1373
MRQIPLRGGPFDGATVPSIDIRNGRYTVTHLHEAPGVSLTPEPDSVIDVCMPPQETAAYELRRTYTPEYTATRNEAIRLRREYEAASEEERRDMVSMLSRVEEHLLWFSEVNSRVVAEEWLEYTGRA